MLEQMIEGYAEAFDADSKDTQRKSDRPDVVHDIMNLAESRSWKHLAKERLENLNPTIPLGKRFWPITRDEKREIGRIFQSEEMRRLTTLLRSRKDDAVVGLLDAAYWVKGCSSLGRFRFAVLLGVEDKSGKNTDYCLMDVKEAIAAAAPRYPRAKMPRNNAERVIEGARHLAPFIGERMRPESFLGRSVFVRELRPQDMKPEIEQLTRDEATKLARFLATVVGSAHARQMDGSMRNSWQKEMRKNRTKSLDAPSWLWSSVVELLVSHEGDYLEHCRKYAREH
jgi:uncharacterized protein (DUF2252 family)